MYQELNLQTHKISNKKRNKDYESTKKKVHLINPLEIEMSVM